MSEDKWPTFFGFAWLSGGNTSRVAEAQVAQVTEADATKSRRTKWFDGDITD